MKLLRAFELVLKHLLHDILHRTKADFNMYEIVLLSYLWKLSLFRPLLKLNLKFVYK